MKISEKIAWCLKLLQTVLPHDTDAKVIGPSCHVPKTVEFTAESALVHFNNHIFIYSVFVREEYVTTERAGRAAPETQQGLTVSLHIATGRSNITCGGGG